MPAIAVPHRPTRSRRETRVEVAVPATPAELRRRAEAAPGSDPRFRLVEVDDAGAVLARRVNWATWGDRFELAWRADGEDAGSAVRITAVKRFPTVLGDYGQGVRDLRALTALLRAGER